MMFYFAPLEGLTGSVYRRAHAAVIGGVDQYFTPFYSPGSIGLSKRQMAELEGEDRSVTVPQLLVRRIPDFLAAITQLYHLGYPVVNLNFGCPSGTVTAKQKGAGFLQQPEQMRAFFEEAFDGLAQKAPGMRLSVKTRIGYSSEDEFAAILAVYNEYPISELIIHPRLRQDFYRGEPRHAAYTYAEQHAKMPLCYNGDIFSADKYHALFEKHPNITRVMLGRGAVADPFLFQTLRGVSNLNRRDRLRQLHDLILEENRRRMGDGKNLLCRMADLWNYQCFLFEESEAVCRRIRRARDLGEYTAAVAFLFREGRLLPGGAYHPPTI